MSWSQQTFSPRHKLGPLSSRYVSEGTHFIQDCAVFVKGLVVPGNSEALPQTLAQTWLSGYVLAYMKYALGRADEAQRCWMLDVE